MTRAEVLGRHDLRDLLDRFVGAGHGVGGRGTWPCPAPDHGPQTGRTPPVSVFTARNGDQRWKCHSCGAGGTAIDLVRLVEGATVGEAFQRLAGTPTCATPRPPTFVPQEITGGLDAIETWVSRAEDRLWRRPGESARRWLFDRGFSEPVLRANRIGYHVQAAAHAAVPGIPNTTGIVLPVMAPNTLAVYGQLRTLRYGEGPKYLSPSAQLARPVSVAPVRPPELPQNRHPVFVCEGMFDALTVVQTGWRACAVLGAANAGDRVADQLTKLYPGRELVLAFDNDDAGHQATQRLSASLVTRGVEPSVLTLPAGIADLNEWRAVEGPEALAYGLARGATIGLPEVGLAPG